MQHRHLNHQALTLAAIDDLISRGHRNDWVRLRQAAHQDPGIFHIQLANPLPYDLEGMNLAEYKNLDPQWQQWQTIQSECIRLSVLLFYAMDPVVSTFRKIISLCCRSEMTEKGISPPCRLAK